MEKLNFERPKLNRSCQRKEHAAMDTGERKTVRSASERKGCQSKRKQCSKGNSNMISAKRKRRIQWWTQAAAASGEWGDGEEAAAADEASVRGLSVKVDTLSDATLEAAAENRAHAT